MKEYFLKYNGFNVCIYENGTGEIPVVLVHGAGLDSVMLSWKEVINLFPDRYTVYAIDLLGQGKSDKPQDMAGDMFYERHIECLGSIIEQLGLDQFVLSGFSMGGAISIGYTLKYADKVKALIPIDSWGLVTKVPFHRLCCWCMNTSLTVKLFPWFAKHKWLVKWSISHYMIGDKSKISKELIDTICDLCKDTDAVKSMQDYQRSSITKHNVIPDFTNCLQQISTPVLFINGEKDPLVLVKDAVKASKAVKNGHIHIMKGCKHWSQKERQEEYVEVTDKFICSLSGM